eukprot:3347890-Rhodomonas_salina.1
MVTPHEPEMVTSLAALGHVTYALGHVTRAVAHTPPHARYPAWGIAFQIWHGTLRISVSEVLWFVDFASKLTSPNVAPAAILRRIRRMILPLRVLGSPGAQWITSGATVRHVSTVPGTTQEDAVYKHVTNSTEGVDCEIKSKQTKASCSLYQDN